MKRQLYRIFAPVSEHSVYVYFLRRFVSKQGIDTKTLNLACDGLSRHLRCHLDQREPPLRWNIDAAVLSGEYPNRPNALRHLGRNLAESLGNDSLATQAADHILKHDLSESTISMLSPGSNQHALIKRLRPALDVLRRLFESPVFPSNPLDPLQHTPFAYTLYLIQAQLRMKYLSLYPAIPPLKPPGRHTLVNEYELAEHVFHHLVELRLSNQDAWRYALQHLMLIDVMHPALDASANVCISDGRLHVRLSIRGPGLLISHTPLPDHTPGRLSQFTAVLPLA